MYAVFATGGKQYRAAPGEVIRVEKLEADEGAGVEFDQVLMVADGDDIKIGNPMLSGGKVTGEVTAHGRGDKIRIIKMRRRKHSRKTQGHRQHYTEVRIKDIKA